MSRVLVFRVLGFRVLGLLGPGSSRRGRDKLGFHRRATNPHDLRYVALSPHVLPHSVTFGHICNSL